MNNIFKQRCFSFEEKMKGMRETSIKYIKGPDKDYFVNVNCLTLNVRKQ